jgi:hypothetical protein
MQDDGGSHAVLETQYTTSFVLCNANVLSAGDLLYCPGVYTNTMSVTLSNVVASFIGATNGNAVFSFGYHTNVTLNTLGTCVINGFNSLLASAYNAGQFSGIYVSPGTTFGYHGTNLVTTYCAIRCIGKLEFHGTIDFTGATGSYGLVTIRPLSGCSSVDLTGMKLLGDSTGLAKSDVYVYARPAGETCTCNLVLDGMTVTCSNPGSSVCLQLGTFNTGITRAANEALTTEFTSVSGNGMYLSDSSGAAGAIWLFPGFTGAVFKNCYFSHVTTIGTGSNVHVIYLYADNIQLINSIVQGSVLAFGNNQIISGNVIFSDFNEALLLGGTQGGTTVSGGGNNYTINNNTLICTDAGGLCLSDYAYLGAYSDTHKLTAAINNNVYFSPHGNAIVKLADTGLLGTNLTQLHNIWLTKSLDGTGTTNWGTASNTNNDVYSTIGKSIPF